MRVATAIRPVDYLRLCAVALILFVFAAESPLAQQFQFGFASPAKQELTAPQVDIISGPTASRLEQARALAADKNWEEAVDAYSELAADESDRVVELDDGRYLNLRTYCHLQLASLPAEALEVYRRRVDSLAERWYREGLAARDERLLNRVVDELVCSSWGDDALMALGELALERGDYAAARRSWEQISPLLREPSGLPTWLALRDIDLNAHWSDIERRWGERPQSPDWLAYPDTRLDLADVRVRLVLVSLRAGELERAALEFEVFRRLHPTAEGQLAGQDGPLATALQRLVSSASEWPSQSSNADWSTFAGSPARSQIARKLGPTLVPAWTEPVDIALAVLPKSTTQVVLGEHAGGGFLVDQPPVAIRESQRPISCFPIVFGDLVAFADASGIHAVDLIAGTPRVTANGVVYRDEATEKEKSNASFVFPGGSMATGVPRYTLTAVDRIVYGRVGQLATSQLGQRSESPADRLVGLDLARDALLTFRARPEDASWSFDGAPVGDERHMFAAMRRSDVTPHAYVACFDAVTGSQLWRSSIGSADTPSTGGGEEVSHNLLTFVGDRIYFNSNLGLVAALDAKSGKICWLHEYDRAAGGDLSGPLHFDRDPAPCLYHGGLLIVAPSDTPAIFALDADTGKKIWATDELTNAIQLLGVVNQNLIVSGNQLRALDVRSGTVKFVWPDSEHAGIRGMGRGLVGGDEVFWPTRTEIQVIDAATGAPARPPISLRGISDCGANLAAAYGYLVVAGREKLMAFGPTPPNKKEKIQQQEPIASDL